jgi:hypothetical protein
LFELIILLMAVWRSVWSITSLLVMPARLTARLMLVWIARRLKRV